MPELKGFTATNTFRTDDSGYSAYGQFARRAGAQYEQAGNDIRDIGRAKAATINMLGRWPFNILELQKRETERYAQGTRGSQQSGAPGGVSVVSRPRSGIDYGGTTGLYPQMRMPNLAALNEMSEGAGAFGRMMGQQSISNSDYDKYGYRPPGSQYGNLTDLRLRREYDEARQEAYEERERARQEQLEYAAAQKRWDLYEKNLDKYNTAVEEAAQKATPYGTYGVSNDPGSPYVDPNSVNFPTTEYYPPTMGGTGKPDDYKNDPSYYGGGGSDGGWF